MQAVKLAIAEDHKVFRKGVILSLKPYHHLQFVMEAGNGQELIQQFDAGITPDVVLMDIRMPVIDGIETTRYLSKHFPMVRIICLTMFEDRQFVDEMMRAGALAYLLKNADPNEINSSIEAVMNGSHPQPAPNFPIC
ncbi:MAG TPA: response regulator transcription factor [Chitinophagaceae bacterium]|nr:response regulator transcription factor [Chitinophagaceae bacterium]